jgi:putative membrane protein
VLGRYLKMLVYDSQYSKFFLGVPGVLLVAGALAVIFDAGKWITAIILAILGGAFIVRAFDIDRTVSSFGRLTPTSFIKIFSVIAGVLIILASVANGVSSIPTDMLRPDMGVLDVLGNRVIVGSFTTGTVTLLWIGIATILGGFLLSDWFRGSARTMSDILRLVVLALLYIPVLQFTSVLTEGTNPFSLISSLLIGLAVSLVAATFLYQYFRNKKGGEVLKH